MFRQCDVLLLVEYINRNRIMKETINNHLLSDLCQVVGAKSYTLPILPTGKPKATLYIPSKYEIGTQLSSFVTVQKDSGFFLLSSHGSDLLYCSFILNSGIGMLYMHDEKDASYTKGTVTKRKLENVTIKILPERYKRACILLEIIITRVSSIEVEGDATIVRDATISFLTDMRSYIGLELYMEKVFKDKQVSVIEPWTSFLEERGGSYKLNQIDDVLIAFYKTISNPENDIMDAMKKARLFVWELSESMKKD